ncbi:MAG: TIGR03936 family radical SAM-associated protein [Oscillospiraceae bacterium]
MQNIRIFFTKTGMAKYISHLDLMRCIMRAIKRANLPIWYTEGYNPHPFMTFALPLPLGTESLCECVDIKLKEEIKSEDIIKLMNDVLPVDIKVTKAAEPVLNPREIAFADYKITFYTDNSKSLNEYLETILNKDEILAEKKSKKGKNKIFKQINLKEQIKSFSVANEEKAVIINTVLNAGSSNNLNPTLLTDTLIKNFDKEIECIDIVKLNIYTELMKEFE